MRWSRSGRKERKLTQDSHPSSPPIQWWNYGELEGFKNYSEIRRYAKAAASARAGRYWNTLWAHEVSDRNLRTMSKDIVDDLLRE